MESGFIKLDCGSYLNIDHIISIEEIVEGEKKGGTMFFTTDPTEGLIKYDDSRSPDKIIELIELQRSGLLKTGTYEYRCYGNKTDIETPYWIEDTGSSGDLGL